MKSGHRHSVFPVFRVNDDKIWRFQNRFRDTPDQNYSCSCFAFRTEALICRSFFSMALIASTSASVLLRASPTRSPAFKQTVHLKAAPIVWTTLYRMPLCCIAGRPYLVPNYSEI